MDTKMAKRIEDMKKQTIGVEIEMAGITRGNAIRVIAKYFGTENTVHYVGGTYRSWKCTDNQGRTWVIARDSSIDAPEDMQTELATPILHYEDIETLQEVARELRRAGAVSNADVGCGVHIHIGADTQTPQSLRNLANIMASHEALIKNALDLDESRMRYYCRPVDENFLKEVNKKKPSTMEALADVWYGSQGASFGRNEHYNKSRYHMLNLHATFTKGTVEFRLFQFDKPTADRRNGIHAGQLKAYIQFCLALCQMAKEVKSASAKPQQAENPKYAMRTWLLRLGFIGDEFQTAREVFTKRLHGDTAFRRSSIA